MSDKDNKSFEEDFEILPEDYSNYDISFKIIIVGNKSNSISKIIIFN